MNALERVVLKQFGQISYIDNEDRWLYESPINGCINTIYVTDKMAKTYFKETARILIDRLREVDKAHLETLNTLRMAMNELCKNDLAKINLLNTNKDQLKKDMLDIFDRKIDEIKEKWEEKPAVSEYPHGPTGRRLRRSSAEFQEDVERIMRENTDTEDVQSTR